MRWHVMWNVYFSIQEVPCRLILQEYLLKPCDRWRPFLCVPDKLYMWFNIVESPVQWKESQGPMYGSIVVCALSVHKGISLGHVRLLFELSWLTQEW